METTLLTTKVKAKSCFFILCLCCQQYFIESSSSIKKSDVAKYLIRRKADHAGDVFSVLFKQGCNHDRCRPTSTVNFCDKLSAYSTTSPGNFPYSCACKESKQTFTFLPEEGKCVTHKKASTSLPAMPGTQALPAIGCSQYMMLTSWESLFLNGFNLGKNGSGLYSFQNSSFHSCKVIPGSPMYYDNLGRSWKRILPDIFTVRFDQYSGIFLEWVADTKNTLSGRILSLVVTCNYRAANNPPFNGCLLFKAVGDVTYNYVNQSVAQKSGYPSSTISSSVPTKSTLHVSTSMTLSLLSSPSLMLPMPSSSSSLAVTTTVQVSLKTPATSLASSFFPRQSQNSQTSDQSKITESSTVSPSKPEARSTVSFSSLEGLSNVLVSTITLKPAIKTNVFSVHPSKPSLTTKAASSSAAINRPGNKNARVTGNDNGVVIGAAVGGAAVCGIFIIIIIVFCKRRKPWRNQEKTTKLQVKNPVYGSSDIPLSSATENQVTTSMDQDSQPTYQDLIAGKLSGTAIYSNPDDNDYDNYSAYQSLDKKVPGSPVYQSLTKGQVATGKPTPKSKPNATGPLGERRDDTTEPVYNVVEQPDTEQGTMPEQVSRDSDEHTQEPVYNVLDGSDSEENYEAGDSLYNVLEEPESIQDQQQPLYNVLESSDAEKSSQQGAQGSCGLSNEPLYNVVEGPDSDGPNEIGVGYDGPNGSTSSDGHDNPTYEEGLNFGPTESGVGSAAPNGSSSPDAHDNPAYEQSIDFDVPYASVQRPGSQRESVYEPLKEQNDQDLYEPLK